MTVPLVLDGRELWVAVSGVDFGEGTVYALQDVTDEHALEKTRSDFVATASHELRTPLAAVYGAVRTLRREDVELSENDRTTFLEMIESEALRLSHIVDQILLAGQLDADAVELRLTECNPAELAAGVIESASVHLPDGISLNLVADASSPIMCDDNKLRQVLVNLLDNAIKYSPDGGKVEILIDAGRGPLRDRRLRRGSRDPDLRAREDLREVLSPRPAADEGRRRQRPGALHLPRAGRAHGRAAERRVGARRGLALHRFAAGPLAGYQPRVSSSSSAGMPAAASPLIASPRPPETRARISGSRKCVVASTIAFARGDGSSDL